KLNRDVFPFFQAFAKDSGLGQNRALADKIDVLFAVPHLLLDACRTAASGMGLQIAAQNAHFEPSGAYTGETSLAMLSECGIRATLIGHSERRQYFGETDACVARKAAAAQAQGFLAVVCVGETLTERNGNQTEAVLQQQLTPV